MRYSEVSVNSPIARRRTFSYSIPEGLALGEGQAVWVPFGEKVLQGIVMELSPQPAVAETREIIGIIEPEPVILPQHLQLARWLSEYYLSPLFEAVSLMLPPGFERKALTFLSAARQDIDLASLTDDQRRVLELVGWGRVGLGKLEKALGQKKASSIVSGLVKQDILSRSYEMEPIRVRPKKELYIGLAAGAGETPRLTPRQAALYNYLKERHRPVLWSEAREAAAATRTMANALVTKGLTAFEEVEVRREPFSYEHITPSLPLVLTDAQQAAFDAIKTSLSRQSASGKSPDIFLLHGVTASGKTEVYLQALAEAVRRGKRGIVLVPEISLTPQTIERFAARFPRRVAVLHSRLTLGEQFDEWRRIRDGEFDVVIGPRSALFAPQPDLGLIVIDEEHEWTYKQDSVPHYHAREVAKKLAEFTGAALVMGSATPDVETFYRARNGDYKLLTLPERVTPGEGAQMPPVEVVDMREELKAGSRGLFSRRLVQAVNEAVARREQVILFLNRRGSATFIQCRRCGFVMRCRRCEVALTYHAAGDVLTCHQCNAKIPVPPACPNCRSRQLKFLGTGTQKLEQEVGYTFPRAGHLRWDSDATSGQSSHEEILRKFRRGEASILIGTQMVAKGLDIPSVTLVGVISADTVLNLPDFRAGERTFQLLSQVAGRAGRGTAGGKVVIQTFSPEHYAVQAAARPDYVAFYEQEIAYRRQLNNPPFSRLARLVYTHLNDGAGQRESERMKNELIQARDARGVAGLGFIGPAPAYIHRLRGRFRWQLVLRGQDLAAFLADISLPSGWTVDIDPVSLL